MTNCCRDQNKVLMLIYNCGLLRISIDMEIVFRSINCIIQQLVVFLHTKRILLMYRLGISVKVDFR